LIKTEGIVGPESTLQKHDALADRRLSLENGRLPLFPLSTAFLSSTIGKRPRLRSKIGLNPVDFNISRRDFETRNVEIWNAATPLSTNLQTDLRTDNLEMEKIAEYKVSSSVDGRYAFKRKLGCQYHAPLPILNNKQRKLENHSIAHPSPAFRHFSKWAVRNIFEPKRIEIPGNKRLGFVRKRIGRGGRTVIDLNC